MATSTLVKKLSMAAAGAAFLALGSVGSAQAAAITFDGNLLDGSTQTGSVQPGNNVSNPQGWDFWSFFGNAGDTATVTVRRLVGALDPALGVWFGTEADTSGYTSIFSSGATTPLIAAADDNLAPALPGPFGDPQATFTLANTGFYTVGVSSFASNSTTALLPYSISVQGSGHDVSVPEPASVLGLLAVSALGAGSRLKRKQESKA